MKELLDSLPVYEAVCAVKRSKGDIISWGISVVIGVGCSLALSKVDENFEPTESNQQVPERTYLNPTNKLIGAHGEPTKNTGRVLGSRFVDGQQVVTAKGAEGNVTIAYRCDADGLVVRSYDYFSTPDSAPSLIVDPVVALATHCLDHRLSKEDGFLKTGSIVELPIPR